MYCQHIEPDCFNQAFCFHVILHQFVVETSINKWQLTTIISVHMSINLYIYN